MRRITRLPLETSVQQVLDLKQIDADNQRRQGCLQVEKIWKAARNTRPFQHIVATLKAMTGQRERCMYCLDSHGMDIEHFWPKAPYPERMFLWLNLLLCCTECGRLKGDRFPLSDGSPLLIDPTAEDPWRYLDFDPMTGNVVPRFDAQINNWSPKGLKTVEILHLDQREAMASGYRKTFRRLSRLLSRHLIAETLPPAAGLVSSLREGDDHGLLEWCFLGSGRTEPPFSLLREQWPEVWENCLMEIQGSQTQQL